jgi:hypothetical protein
LLSDTIISYIRTYVPVAVGAALTWLATKFGILVDGDTKGQAILLLGGVVTAVYYAVARTLEKRFPSLGFLLGSRKTPTYLPPPAPPAP